MIFYLCFNCNENFGDERLVLFLCDTALAEIFENLIFDSEMEWASDVVISVLHANRTFSVSVLISV